MRKFPFFILLICSFSFSIKKLEGQIPSNVPRSGLVAWYPFNGNANDESGNGLNGKVDKAILTKDRFGILNKAYYFDSSRVITIPETVNKNLFPLSVSLWVRIDTSKVSGLGNLFGKYIAASWNGFLIQTMRRVDSVGNVTFKIVPWYIRDANNRLLGLYGEEDFATDLIPGKWHHFVFTVGKDKGAAYLDGKLFDTHLWTGNSGESTNPFLWQIGGLYNDWFKGNLDDIGVWNRELTSEEVKNLYDGESTTGQPCSSSPTVKDIDGNTYNTLQIGEQCWTKENLKVTKYNDGSTIPLDNSGGTAGNGSGQTWSTLKTGARTVYGHDNNNLSTYGYLYNGYVVGDNRGICPKGWHIPSLSEWNSLINYVGGAVNAMVNLKSSDSLLWSSPNNIKGTNSSGFSALPGGLRHAGGFGYINWDALWWTSSTTGDRLHYAAMRNSVYNDRIFTFPDDKSYGFSIRCLRDSIIASLKITTTNIGSTTATSAISGGIITSTDNTSVTARGVCWNTTGTPTIQDSKTTDDSGYGSFESNLTYLQPNTLYYLRAYASTPNGTFYGNEITFKTKSLDSNAVVFFTPNVNISCDSIVEIPLLAYNFKGVLGAQGSLGWDASKLKFESIASFGPTSLGLTTNDFGLTDSQKGKISFIWNSINATTVTLPDSTALFVLKFKVIDTKLTTAVVKMNNDPIEIEVVDSNFDKMKFELGTYVINQICAKVSGNVQTSKSLNVPGVILTLSNSLGSKSAITDVNGNYSFSNISLANYTLTPSKLTEAKPRNGVSTLDIGLIQAHVLNKKPFQTPYQVIAADVNGSGTITAADIILIRRFILGAETNFGGKLYSFVDKKHVFTNPLNPFPFPQSININNTQNQVVGDFIGVKLGDVNFDNTPQNFVPKASRDRKIEFVYEIITPTVSKRSNEVIYRIKSAKQQELLGMQFTLNWDSKLAELMAVEHNPLGIFLANETGDNGSLGLSWNAGSGTPKMLQENEVVFEIRVKLNARYMSVPLNINDDLLEREAFDADFKVKELSLKLENVSNTVISTEVNLNVFPNPAQGNFTLNFNSNMAEKGYILLTDMLGRTLVNQEIQISKGMNNVMIDLPANIVTGTHNLQLRTSNTFETVKILIDNSK